MQVNGDSIKKTICCAHLSLFLNDIELLLQANMNAGITIYQLSINLLLFAHESVLIRRGIPIFPEQFARVLHEAEYKGQC